MNRRMLVTSLVLLFGVLLTAALLEAQPGQDDKKDKKDPENKDFEKKDFEKKGFPFGPFGGFKGGPMGQKVKLVAKFDQDKDGRLNAEERQGARVQIKKDREGKAGIGFGKKGFGFKGGMETGKPGPTVTPAEVKNYGKESLYDPTVLRTVFLDFDGKDWEAELADFYKTDVEVPATLTVDGKKYPNVGVHFRGMSSFFTVPAGSKRSLNISLNFVDEKQRLLGYRTLNLLNSHDDPTFMHTVLFSEVARNLLPAPKANYVKLVINGESWGLYVNAQQFNADFLKENFKTTKGARWKVKGSPGAGGGLDYIGDNSEDYKKRYEIKSKDDEKSWKALIALCKTLSKTPLDELEKALEPMLDIDGALRFLALDIALINSDGYWIRASDYNLYLDPQGKFHVIPHDMNETFGPGMGPGMGKGPPKGGDFGKGPKEGELGKEPKDLGPGKGPRSPLALDPLQGLDDVRKPLRSRLLSVPSLKARYLEHVRIIAQEHLDWKNLGPRVAKHRALIEKEIELDTRKLTSLASFQKVTADAAADNPGPGRGPGMSLRSFADQRREFLLSYPGIKKATP